MMYFRQSASRVRKKLQAELAYDSVKSTALERKGLAVRGHRQK
jgi:hypothetical protein